MLPGTEDAIETAYPFWSRDGRYVVYRVGSVCNARGIPHPMIVSESGRAIAAHHSVLIFNTLGSSALDRFEINPDEAERAARDRNLPQPVRDLFDAWRNVD